MEMKSYFNNPTSRNEVFRKICVQEQIIKIKVEKYSNYLKLMEISMVPRTFTPPLPLPFPSEFNIKFNYFSSRRTEILQNILNNIPRTTEWKMNIHLTII